VIASQCYNEFEDVSAERRWASICAGLES
jgi:hypothetical protein